MITDGVFIQLCVCVKTLSWSFACLVIIILLNILMYLITAGDNTRCPQVEQVRKFIVEVTSSPTMIYGYTLTHYMRTTHTRTDTHIRSHIRAHAHTCMHTHTHTHTHIYTYTHTI